MAGRRTNRALLWATVLALMTGVATFTVGTETGGLVVIAHGVVALAIVVLIPWKTKIAGRGMRRNRSGRAMSLVVTIFVLATLVTGVVLTTGLTDRWGPFTMMQLHVSFGLGAVSLTLMHTLQRPSAPVDRSRRNFLRAGGLVTGAGALWLLAEGGLDVLGVRGGNRRFTGSHEVSDPKLVPVTQWINDRVPHLPSDHTVDIVGTAVPVGNLDGSDRLMATLDCTGGWYTTQVWSGTRLDRLIEAGSGASLVVRSVTGYWRRFPLDQAGHLLLATRMTGEPLRDGHGGPVRLVAHGRRGYWWVKWIDRIEVDDTPPWWQPPLPTA